MLYDNYLKYNFIYDYAQYKNNYFKSNSTLALDIENEKFNNVSMSILSMGMTNDYEVAIEEGATLIRVGTAIFGARSYP